MTTDHVEVRPGAYADSVALLQVSRSVQALPGVVTAQVAMATALNLDVLAAMGFVVPPDADVNDMVVALRLQGDDPLAVQAEALAGVDRALADARRRPSGPGGGDSGGEAPHRTTATALRESGHDDPGTVVLVSVPGPSAFVEAMDAVAAGHDVMVFSDNVPLAQEVALKRAAADRGVLVMGPDCGTAVVGGVGLGFANVVPPGPVGLVAASGTGAQQVLALLDHAGVGVAAALGVGGRDLSAAVGGLATREALRRLDADPDVELVVLVSKPPAPEVAAEIEAYAASLDTPVELALLGPGRPDLTEATERVLRRLGWGVPDWPVSGDRRPRAPRPADGAPPGGADGRLRGLYVGGTLAEEARLMCSARLGEVGATPEALATGHAVVDFGDDALTRGRAHPMIDPTVRLEHLARVLADPTTASVLLDVVLGHGAEPDPATALAPLLAGAGLGAPGAPTVTVAVVGTRSDPQDLDRQVRTLVRAGAQVHLSHAAAVRHALRWVTS